MNTKVNFNDINKRIEELLEKFDSNKVSYSKRCSYQNKHSEMLLNEEDLYLLFLETIFHSPESAQAFYNYLPWEKLKKATESDIRKICSTFFEKSKVKIGDHRRNFCCMPTQSKIEHIKEILCSYKSIIGKYGSQRNFFEIDGKPEFDQLYNKMKEIKHFDTRLPRFDHLEKLCRANKFYCTPKRFYVEDDKSGPRDGLTFLIMGERYRKNKQVKEYLLSVDFSRNWNANVISKYSIAHGESIKSVLQTLEQWTIENVKKNLKKNQQGNPAFIFDLETNLCNWQKRKKSFV